MPDPIFPVLKKRLYLKPESGWLIKWMDFVKLRDSVVPADVRDPKNAEVLGHLSLEEREEFALRAKMPVLYLGDEIRLLSEAEEAGALAAAPDGVPLAALNGINIGAGGRTVSKYLLPVDIMREAQGQSGEHALLTSHALLAAPDDLPFRENSLDLIVALHMLEHIGDPVSLLKYWLGLLKPGGGIGLVLPDWRYAWDARFDQSKFGHKWNSTPELMLEIHDAHLSDLCHLEALNTYEFKLSFDVVLRKPGTFEAFDLSRFEDMKSGAQLAEEGSFLHKN